MAGTFVANGTEVMIAFTYTTSTEKASTTINDAARYLVGIRQPDVDFESLSNQQKLDIVDMWVKKNILKMARRQGLEDALYDARVTEAESADERYL